MSLRGGLARWLHGLRRGLRGKRLTRRAGFQPLPPRGSAVGSASAAGCAVRVGFLLLNEVGNSYGL